jgi:hypothetical protein
MTEPRRRRKRNPDPLGKNALFSPPPSPTPKVKPADEQPGRPDQGVRALYSTAGEPRLGTVVMECSDCLVRTRVSLHDVTSRILRFSIWIPGKSHSRWLLCPACEQRTWSRIRWTG